MSLPGWWTCHICRTKRPDARISVLSKPVASMPSLTGTVRYCNDRPGCVEGAKTFTFMKGGADGKRKP